MNETVSLGIAADLYDDSIIVKPVLTANFNNKGNSLNDKPSKTTKAVFDS